MRHSTRPDAEQVPARWHAARLLDAPHRLCFFWAGMNWAGAALWWAGVMCARALGAFWPMPVSAALAHGLWFSLGAMPLFIAGFMLTAGPKWLRRPTVAAPGLRLAVGLFTLGWVVAAAGFHLGVHIAAAGLALVCAGWGALTWRIVGLVASSTQADRRHAWLIAFACITMLVCLGLSSVALVFGRADLLRPMVQLGLWGGVTMVFVVVSHRLLPILGAGAWPWLQSRWPDWPLWVVASVPMVHSVGAIVEPWRASMPDWRGFEALHLLAVAVLCLCMSWRLLWLRALRQPLVAMLFIAFLWWDLSLWLGAVARLPGLAQGTVAAIELAAIHALTMGFLGGSLLVMATRVSRTLSGRPLAVDRVARWLYGLLQLAVVLRLLAALAPSWAATWTPWAALAWMGVALVWAARHGRWLGSARIDGRPG